MCNFPVHKTNVFFCPASEILDEVQQSYPVDSLEDCSDPGQCTVSRAVKEPWPAELLLVVSHLLAVLGLVLWVGLEKSK